MLFFKSRRHTGAVLCILITAAAMLLSSCGGGSQTPGKREALSNLSSMQIATGAGQGALYEITQPAGAERGGDLCCVGLYDETHVLLLNADRDSGNTVTGYTTQLLDLCSSEKEDLLSFDRIEVPGGSSDGTESLSLLSCDPLIVYDSAGGILYQPGRSAKTVILPDYLGNAVPGWQDGHLWLSSDRGILCEVTQEGDLRTAWTLPCEYGAFTPVVCGHSGRLSFATYSRRDPSLQVYVDVDPVLGESEYYLSDINPSRFTVAQDGLLLGSSFRTVPAVSVCDRNKHVKKELELPAEILALINADDSAVSPGSENSFLAFSTFPLSLCGDWCCWSLNDDRGRPVHIYLWDTASCRSVDWKIPSVSEYTAPEITDYGTLTEKAGELEDKYGIRILLGTNIPTEFSDYSAEPFTDPAAIEGSLSVLENVLSLYPPNYFTKLKGNYYRNIVFYLTGALRPLNAGSNISNAGAFATESGGTMQLAFDLYDDLSPDTVIHELTHAADYRFAGEGLLDEDAWNSMNPEGFSYYFAYIDENGQSYETAGSADNTAVSGCPADEVWFIDPYSKTYPMEDRARLMETLLSGRTPYSGCFKGRHMQEKLSFYFRFLRETLGDDSWPEQTSWEEALSAALSD